MASPVRYRTGIDRTTGRPLVGWAHVQQSLSIIWTTRVNTVVMLLEFGSKLRSFLSEDVTPSLMLDLYEDLVSSAHRWEPEYRIADIQLVRLTRTGRLALQHGGVYYPEGRLGNYGVQESANAIYPLADRERYARLAAGGA